MTASANCIFALLNQWGTIIFGCQEYMESMQLY